MIFERRRGESDRYYIEGRNIGKIINNAVWICRGKKGGGWMEEAKGKERHYIWVGSCQAGLLV